MLGNILSLTVFYCQREFWKVSTGLLFVLMIIFNTIHLWTLCVDFLITYSIYLYSNVFFQCRLQLFLLNVTRAMSSYLAMSVTLDRFIRSEMPMRSKLICTRRNAYKVTIIYLVTFSILLSFFFCPNNSQNPSTGACANRNVRSYTWFIQNIFLPTRAVVTCALPIVIMSVASIRVLYNIRQSRHRIRQQGITITNTLDVSVIGTGGDNSRQQVTTRSITALDRALVLMTASNVVTFTITQIPIHVYTVTRNYAQTFDNYTHLLVRALLLIWSSMYFGIGFYLYCFTTPLFRHKSLQIIRQGISFIKSTLCLK